MATAVIMPRQGQSVESCIITKWHKIKGDRVKAGDILFTYETDKAAFDEEAKVEGTLLDIFFEEGEDVPVLTTVCVIGNEGESAEEYDPRARNSMAGSSGKEKGPQAATEAAQSEQNSERQDITGKGGETREGDAWEDEGRQDAAIKISPRARNLAEKIGIEYRGIQGSGPGGRIIEKDIMALYEKGRHITPAAREEYIKAASLGTVIGGEVAGTGLGNRITTEDLKAARYESAQQESAQQERFESVAEGGMMPAVQMANKQEAPQPDYVEVKLTNIRKVIAKAMHHSLSTAAQLTLNTSFDATEILEFRKKLKQSKDKLGVSNITINDMILYAVSRTILKHKDLNAHYLDDKMIVFNNVHLGNAVDTERGLMVPTIFNANLKTLNEISGEARALAEACKKGTINPDMLKGASFTVTNLGALDIESFTPVLNPPQVGILGVNTIVQRVKEVNGEYMYYPSMALSLTFDHRAIDGAPAARFLKDLKTNLENFSVLLAL